MKKIKSFYSFSEKKSEKCVSDDIKTRSLRKLIHIHDEETYELNELNRETLTNAADKADDKGYTKLATRFREHGKEFGTLDTKKEFEMIFKTREGEKNIILRLVSIDSDSNYARSFEMKVEDKDGKPYRIFVNNFGGYPEFYLNEESKGLALNRKEAKKILDILKEEGIDVTSDTRTISYDDVDF